MTPRGGIAVALVVLVTLSTLGAAFPPAHGDRDVPGAFDGMFADGEVADAVMVASSGDALFRFDRPSRAPRNGTGFVDGESGLGYALIAADFEERRNATGTAELDYRAGNVSGVADILVDDPAPLHALDVELDLHADAERASSSLEIDGRVDRTDAPIRSLVGQGTVETGATTTRGEGDLEVELSGGNDTAFALDERREVALTETDRGYRMAVTEERGVGGWERERWNERERALESLRARYTEMAVGLGGEASVTLEAYRYDDTPGARRVSLAYHVEFAGIEDGLAMALADGLAPVADGGMDQDARRLLAERFTEATVERLAISYDQNGSSTALSWEFELAATDTLLHAAAELDMIDRTYREVRDMVEARDEAGFSESFAWNVILAHQDETERMHVEADVETQVDGWARYVRALEDRGLQPVRGETRLDYEATLEPGEPLEVAYDLQASTPSVPRLVLAGTDALVQETTNESVVGLGGRPFAGVDRLRVVTEVTEGHATVEWGASGTSPRELLVLPEDVGVAAVRGASTDEASRVSLVVPEAFPSDPARSSISAHPLVGPTTDVIMSDDWDRGIAGDDRNVARAFLGLEETPERAWPGSAVGFGLLVGVAVLAGAIAYLRNRET